MGKRLLSVFVVGLLGLASCDGTYHEVEQVPSKEKRTVVERALPKPERHKKYEVVTGDCAPRFSEKDGIYVSGDRLWFSVSDLRGTNWGLSKVILYEDSPDGPKVLKEFDAEGSYYFEGMYHLGLGAPKSGKHIYFAEAIDVGGNRTLSEKIEVDFVPGD